ncbi:MAG: glycosyltransferase family 39 protein [Thermoguttaceae bacterium]|jgi:4-amino-4-deoxy-L-arabinose transferase-like glycosyltransferase|nr:glycosyltransferase family 39 protein [Thermoguttaceae bacterium]
MDRHAWKQVGCVLLVALAVRLGAAALWHHWAEGRFFFGDSESYWQLGRAIARCDDYRFAPDGLDARVFRTPGYPLLLAPLFLIGGDEPPLFWARIQGAVVGTLVVGAACCLAWKLFGRWAGLAAGLAAAVYPGAVATSPMVLTETPFSLLMVLQLCAWCAAWRGTSGTRAVWLGLATGAAAGAAVLVRPSWLLFTPGVVALVWAAQCLGLGRKSGSGRVKSTVPGERSRWNEPAVGMAVLAAMLVVLAPWWIRNWRVTGYFVPTTLQVGASLYDGISPQATGASDMVFVEGFVDEERRRDADPVPFEVRLDRRMRREAVEWAKQHPGRVAHLAAVKFVRMWNVWPNEPQLSSWPVRLIVAGTYVPIMVLALAGAWRTFRLGWPYVLCWLPAVYFTLLHMVFVSSIRYREPAMLALIVLAAGAVFPCTTEPQPEQEARKPFSSG